MLWVIFGKPNRTRFDKEQSTNTDKISETLPLARVALFLEYRNIE